MTKGPAKSRKSQSRSRTGAAAGLKRPAVKTVNVSIDLSRIVPHCGSNTLAFEEFCSQLARHVDVPTGSHFQRNGRGADLGLECAWTLPDKRVWGWQAKYVFDVDGLRRQVEESFRSAL